jgi:hypothetical protein
MSDDGEVKFQKLKGWVHAVDDESGKGNPPDVQQGADAFVALRIVLGWCEERMSIDSRRAMALAVDQALGG